MKRLAVLMVLATAGALQVRADHGAPTTRPVAPPEVIPAVEGESAPVELAADGYKVKLSWFPAAPRPGDLVRFRAEILPPSPDATLVVKAGVTRSGPGNAAVLIPATKLEPEGGAAYTWQAVFFTDGIYQVDIAIDDLSMGKSVAVSHTLTMGQVESKVAIYGVAIGGLAAIAIVLAFGLRRPTEAAPASEPA
ncbi:MAG: hypothetical protein HYY18_13365 [Planctomycetes bacterium]|nr:hypothetical protein [Planctomycetota bacterium]